MHRRRWSYHPGSRSMGAGFCNSSRLGCNTQTPLPPSSLPNQLTLNFSKVGREDEGVSSSRPELVALVECLEDHEDDVNLLYLTDSETILQAIRSTKQFGGSNILINTTSHSVDRLRGETQSLQITSWRSGGSDVVRESQRSQGGPSQWRNRHPISYGTS